MNAYEWTRGTRRTFTPRRERRIAVKPGELLHVETPNGIVNIRAGLRDNRGRDVDSIETIPDAYAGEPKVLRRGAGNVRLVRCKGAKA